MFTELDEGPGLCMFAFFLSFFFLFLSSLAGFPAGLLFFIFLF